MMEILAAALIFIIIASIIILKKLKHKRVKKHTLEIKKKDDDLLKEEVKNQAEISKEAIIESENSKVDRKPSATVDSSTHIYKGFQNALVDFGVNDKLLVGADEHCIRVYDLNNPSVFTYYNTQEGSISALALHDNKVGIAYGFEKYIRVYDIGSNLRLKLMDQSKLEPPPYSHQTKIKQICYCGENIYVTHDCKSDIILWMADETTMAFDIYQMKKQQIIKMWSHPQLKIVMVLTESSEISFLRIKGHSLECIYKIPHNKKVASAVITPNFDKLVVILENGISKLYTLNCEHSDFIKESFDINLQGNVTSSVLVDNYLLIDNGKDILSICLKDCSIKTLLAAKETNDKREIMVINEKAYLFVSDVNVVRMIEIPY